MSSALEPLFSSNQPPSPQESSVAGELLQLWDQKLEVVETRITALERELEELKAQRGIVKGERHRYADILSARRLLPPEIIGRFIELACMDDTESSQNLAMHQQVLSFMLVSKEWYRTACGIAHLWTELDMDLTNNSIEETQNAIMKAINQSARASELPLSLRIAFPAANPINTQIVNFLHSVVTRLGLFSLRLQVNSISDLQILDTLLHHSASSSTLIWPRLHTLQISIQSKIGIAVGRELFIPSTNFPPLSTAAISSSNAMHQLPWNDPLKLDSGPLPQLTPRYSQNVTAVSSELSIPSTNFPLLNTAAISSNVMFSQYQLPWNDLLKLDLGPLRQLTPRQCLSILGQCQNLRSLCLRVHYETQSNPSGDLPSITLHQLTHFEFENADAQEGPARQLLSQLRLPSLRSCTYTVLHGGGFYSTVIPKLAELFQRSGCLQSMEQLELNLSRGLAHTDTLENLFRAVPLLTVLKLSGQKMDPDTLRDVPISVRDLSIKLSHYRMDDARESLVDYLHSRFASSDVPVRAQLHFVDTARTFTLRKRLNSLEKHVGSSLDVVMD